MYKLATHRLYWRTITVWQAAEDGTLAPSSFDVQLRWLLDEEHTALFQKAAAEGLLDAQVAPALVANFKSLQAADGSELTFSTDNLALLLHEPLVASAIVRGYLDSRREAAAKNFARPPESGPVVAPSSTTAH